MAYFDTIIISDTLISSLISFNNYNRNEIHINFLPEVSIILFTVEMLYTCRSYAALCSNSSTGTELQRSPRLTSWRLLRDELRGER